MQGAMRRLLVLLVLVFSAMFVVAPAKGLAKSKPLKYVLVSETKGCIVTVEVKTGRLTFKAEKGHYGKFTVIVRHGKSKKTYRFAVKKPKRGQKLPTQPVVVLPTQPSGTTVVIVPVPAGAPGPPGTPGTTGPVGGSPGAPGAPPPMRPFPGAPANVSPVLHLNGHTISWANDRGANDFKGAICTDARGTSDRNCAIVDPAGSTKLQTNWTVPTPSRCGPLYYGVASEGSAGELWTNTEVVINWTAGCNVAPTGLRQLSDRSGPFFNWNEDPNATSFKISTCTNARGTNRTCTYAILTPFDQIAGNIIRWNPPPDCGRTLYYGVASEGGAGELWSANEIVVNWGKCPAPFAVTEARTPEPLPPEPTGLTPTASCDANVHIVDQLSAPDHPGAGLDPTAICAVTTLWTKVITDPGLENPPPVDVMRDLCVDYATVLDYDTRNGYIPQYYFDNGTQSCFVVTPFDEYLFAFNETWAPTTVGSGNIVSVFAQDTTSTYPYLLPYTS
jgi:hypothetical protein